MAPSSRCSARRAVVLTTVVAALVLAAPEALLAQEPAAGAREVLVTVPSSGVPSPRALAADHPLVLRPAPSLRPMSGEVRSILGLRTSVPVSVGEDTPEGAPDLVREGEVGIGLTDARTTGEVLTGATGDERGTRLRIVLGGPGRVTYATELTTSAEQPPSARSIALAILALRDIALVGPEPPPYPDPDGPAYTYRAPPDGPLGPVRRIAPLARPTIYFRLLVGFSTARTTVLVGPGVGVGLCLRDDCVVIEGDLPILPEERSALDGTQIEYRPVTLGLRVQLRPIRVDDVTFGLCFGPIMRLGNARVDTGLSQTVTNFGVRGTLEFAWEFVDRFEWVLEGGVDAALNPARFVHGTEVVLLEDVVTAWGVMAMRLRP